MHPMPTTKQRMNLSVPPEVGLLIQKLAEREHVPVATKAMDLLRRALELDEDDVLQFIAEARERRSRRFVSHQVAWK